jgi:hypothetical protein
MENPRKNPIATTDIGYGEHAIGLGSKKLGQTLVKCLSEVNLLLNLPPDMPSRNVMEILRNNLQRLMGISESMEDD